MRAGLSLLCLTYVLSQFYRAFLAVLGPVLLRDIGAGPDDLATASGLWFLAFGLAQLPIGWALDRFGPRRTASAFLAIGGAGGALMFAVAATPMQINIAMMLIGAGCAPILVSAFYLLARQGTPAQFATTASLVLGIGSVGNLGASWPMAFAVETVGWRAALTLLAALTAAAAAALFILLRDPEAPEGGQRGSVLDLLKMRALWPIIPMMFVCYAPAAAVRGLWIGPYLSDVFGLTTSQLGQASLVMGVAMICGTLAYGPLDRVFGTHKWVILIGNVMCAASALALAAFAGQNAVLGIALCAAIGFFGATFPILIAHTRGFFPAHLAGRGVTLMNLFGIGGVGAAQLASGAIHSNVAAGAGDLASYSALFAFFGAALLIGVVIYLFSRDAPA
ncbi:Predicted arabinose efflux permease, MFS family [Roseovarius nanhaiticus]|uniref:Predicted arabinose efflux permease, MFS family n=1 Tax=Roseovarius nanhaiticus TaxID=573024 RepID=A0A1N7ER76_9RHOB|nr:MFS transporter [Roseovarius nanhaiticus]SEK68654.1 Predicted arabinose efflux permease, MFS family [Roseovarius nanhaiticus]SIR90445.1 Predicted arabinose efflux permease, MFS family [Roseovarius nanhaiticus]